MILSILKALFGVITGKGFLLFGYTASDMLICLLPLGSAVFHQLVYHAAEEDGV